MIKPTFRHPNRILFAGDLILIIACVFGSFALRLPLGPLFVFYLPQALWMIAIALLIKPLVYYNFGLYRRVWAYASTRELKMIAAAVTTASALVALVVILLTPLRVYEGFPRSVLAIDWLLSLLAVGGSRFALRLLAESRSGANDVVGRTRRVLIVGAGDAGALVVREMQKNPQLHLLPICFVDDDPAKQKQRLHDVPVEGTLEDLGHLVKSRLIQEVIIAIPSAPGRVVRRVTEICRENEVQFRTMPGIYELIGGKINVGRLREVEITDLLRRAPVEIDENLIGISLSGRKVLITGAGGSIGRELCRQVARWGPSSLIIVGHGENSIFETLMELEESFLALPVHPVVADIRDPDRIGNVLENYRPQVIFHAAAHKHVPLMEVNVEEAITNNILGTRNIVEAALNSGVERLVMISTDKAIRPTSVMGATKRMAEMIVLDAAHRSGLAYSVVRFGNVLGSRGSVIPLFKHQIARGGPVTITHPEMERYFMTIPEAVHLVLQAAAMGQGGEVFVLRMGEQVRILDLAEDLIRLSGLEPEKDVEIVFTGIRPGEKLSEELWDQWAVYEPTTHADIVQLAEQDLLANQELGNIVNELAYLAGEGDVDAIVRLLDRIIPGAAVRSTPPPDLTSIL
ncbi:MAG TPA: nucleoside-diphosphate sugar epimerase/dehydratase [Anaerolineales bacterium]|nr:nucleoside-diphosphate sugar epimerase/dehydratase [Anaerolineales bacterium]